MAHARNNMLFYFGVPLTSLGGSGDKTSVVGVLGKYDYLVVKPHTGVDLAALKELLQHYRTIKPAAQVFGAVTFTDLATTQSAITQWQTDLGGDLSGIFIEDFGLASRADQNTLIGTVHGMSLSVFADGTSPFELFETLDADPDTTLGRSSTIKDYVLVDGFYVRNQNVPTPALETREHLSGRMDYLKRVIVNASVTPAVPYNIGLMVAPSAGSGTGIAQADYNIAIGIANQYNTLGFGVHNFDKGVANASYFMKHAANVFID